jgi:hypothetical protein
MTREQEAKAAEIAAEIRQATAEWRAEKARAKEAAKPKAEVVPLDPWPVGRPWRPEPEPPASRTVTIRFDLAELQRANAEAARAARRGRDPFGIGLYGHETLGDLVRRQNGED